MATTIKRKAVSFRLQDDEPNAETLAAMKECESGVELEDFDPNEL